VPGRGRQSAALNRMSLPGEPAGRGRKAGRHRMCHPRRSVRQRNEVKKPRSGARTASPYPAPDCVITCRLTDWHYAMCGLFYSCGAVLNSGSARSVTASATTPQSGKSWTVSRGVSVPLPEVAPVVFLRDKKASCTCWLPVCAATKR
jgi:hypothetical protein